MMLATTAKGEINDGWSYTSATHYAFVVWTGATRPFLPRLLRLNDWRLRGSISDINAFNFP